MKKVVVSLVSAAALAAITAGMAAGTHSTVASSENYNNDDASGIVVSGDLGYATTGVKKYWYAPQPTSLDNAGFAWRGALGYQFNKNFAVEGGYTQLHDVVAKLNDTKFTTSLSGFDLVAKGILPINDQFSAFAKAGAMDVHEKVELKDAGTTLAKVTGSAWTPELGLGAAYNVNQNVALTLQDIYTFKTDFQKTVDGLSGKVKIPYTNSILAGVSYKFSV